MIWIGDREFGSLVSQDEALVSVRDFGFTVGDGLFETLKVVDGRAFALRRHLARLVESTELVGLRQPDLDVIRAAVDEVLFANAPLLGDLARLRITYTAGLGTDRDSALPTLVVTATPMAPWSDTTSVATVPWVRNERSAIGGVKSTSYAEGIVALEHAHRLGASEAVFANTRGELCEGATSNVFVVVDGAVLTPPLTSGCLPGVTRELVLEWTEAREQVFPYDALMIADEVFITSSTRDVHPVVRVDDRELAVGPVTNRIREVFAVRSAAGIDP